MVQICRRNRQRDKPNPGASTKKLINGGVTPSASPLNNKSINENFYDLIEALCGRFIGLSPFEVMNTETRDVYDLYVDVIIHDKKEGKNTAAKKDGWVTSKEATWH